ncbi:MAG: hddC 2 [Gammaproteobacteria bacterium]|jgi:D-glycero-alpha-D-manno-heptose 1-phosphate guanylyltransferase|nr:hddC 2 [Gammaproteobacteria bacterium]
MQAIILAGGFGTRLQSVIKNSPKPMALIHGKPFLAYLLDYLKFHKITKIILSVHYLREQIQIFFKTNYEGMDIRYAIEDQPLGTGGAIVNAFQYIDTSESVFVINGDTFLQLDYEAMLAQHHKMSSVMTIALRKMANCSRYGVVLTDGHRVTGFGAQGSNSAGLINAGVYLMKPSFFQEFPVADSVFSFERDFLFHRIEQLCPDAFIVDDYFIDIGVPEDYARAIKDFASGRALV